jgi:biotin synthase
MTIFTEAQRLYDAACDSAITNEDLDTIIRWPAADLPVLFAAADMVRRKFFSQTVDPCALLNIKAGGCSEDCAFCSQSAHNSAAVTKRDLASPQEIIEANKRAVEKNLTFCVVSSGKRLDKQELASVVSALSQCKGELHASLGILAEEDFIALRDAGVVCYNHNLETSRDYYPKIVSTHDYQDRVDTVRAAKKAGLSVCCGGIFGMGESWADRKSMCMELRTLQVDTIPINFLNAIPGTRLSAPTESPMDFLRIVAMFRFAHPDKVIKVCGGREVNLGKLQPLIFMAGANGYISGDYLTTKGDTVESDDAMITALGLKKKHSCS